MNEKLTLPPEVWEKLKHEQLVGINIPIAENPIHVHGELWEIGEDVILRESTLHDKQILTFRHQEDCNRIIPAGHLYELIYKDEDPAKSPQFAQIYDAFFIKDKNDIDWTLQYYIASGIEFVLRPEIYEQYMRDTSEYKGIVSPTSLILIDPGEWLRYHEYVDSTPYENSANILDYFPPAENDVKSARFRTVTPNHVIVTTTKSDTALLIDINKGLNPSAINMIFVWQESKPLQKAYWEYQTKIMSNKKLHYEESEFNEVYENMMDIAVQTIEAREEMHRQLMLSPASDLTISELLNMIDTNSNQ